MTEFQTRGWEKGHKLLADDFNDLEQRIAVAVADDPDVPSGPAFGDPLGQPADLWVPVFGDDFDQAISVKDANAGVIQFGKGPKWRTWYGGSVVDDGGHTNNGPKGLGWYQTDQVTQSGSSAFLKATYQPNDARPDHPYLTGMLESIDFTPVHGYFEARVKYSGVQGTWPAVWLRAVDTWPPEIDILEQYGQVRDNKITTWANDTPFQTGSLNGQYISSTDPDTWIVVACEWDADKIVFYYDGVEVAREENRNNVPDRPMYLMLDMQIDADQFGTNIDDYPTAFEVDYYRAWQKKEMSEVYFDEKWPAEEPLELWSTVLGSGSITVAPNGGSIDVVTPPGAWNFGPTLHQSAMTPARDLRLEMEFEFDDKSQHYMSVYLRSDGSERNCYQLTVFQHTNQYEISRMDENGQMQSLQIVDHVWPSSSVPNKLIWDLNGGVLKSKIWESTLPEPIDWDTEMTLGLDKALPVNIQPGGVLITFLNGPDGAGHTVTLGEIKLTKAIQPDPVEVNYNNPTIDYVTHEELEGYATKLFVTEQIDAIQPDKGIELLTYTRAGYDKWFSALEKMRAGTRDAKLMVVGDSTSQGFTVGKELSWVEVLRKRLARHFLTKSGLALPDTEIGPTSTQWVRGSWGLAFGPGGGALYGEPSTTAVTPATYNPGAVSGEQVDTFDVYWYKAANKGTFTANARGTSQSINTNSTDGSSGWNVTKLTTALTAAGGVSLAIPTVNPVSALVDAYATAGPKGVRVSNLAVSGSRTDTWADGPYSKEAISAWAPDLTIIMLGINDALVGREVNDWVANMQTLITEAKKSGDVLLMSVVPTNPGFSGGFVIEREGAYRDAIPALAQANDLGYFDMLATIGGYSPEWYGQDDGVHPNARLHTKMARWVFDVFGQF